MNPNHKLYFAIASFIASILFGGAGIIIPPPGVIDSSVLIFIAQMLLFCSTLLGLSLNLGSYGKTEKQNDQNEKDKNS